jgi:hypothetical protein
VITGTSLTFAQGGASGSSGTPAANTGSGGRGRQTAAGTNGASGIVVVRYRLA